MQGRLQPYPWTRHEKSDSRDSFYPAPTGITITGLKFQIDAPAKYIA